MLQRQEMGTRLMAASVGVLLAAAVLPGAAHALPAPMADEAATEGLLSPGSTPESLSALSLMPWHTAPSLAALRREVDRLWPARSRVSDGTIGDVRHSRTRNSHNPVGSRYGPRVGTRGAVHALDITASGIDVDRLLSALIGDSRLWYIIHNGKIWSRTTNWASRPTWGDPHRSHIHINLREDSQSAAVAAERDTTPWLSGKPATGPAFQSSPSKTSLTTAQVRTLQRSLIKKGFAIPAGATGFYGDQTTRAVAAFQRAQGWRGSEADGLPGPETLRRLGVSASTATPVSTTKPKPAKKSTSKPAAIRLSAKQTRKLQKRLIKRGFAIPAGATGFYGAQTTRAVAAFQRAQGWRGSEADGLPGPETLRRLGVSDPKPPKPKNRTATKKPTKSAPKAVPAKQPASAGLSKAETRKVQRQLIKRGFDIPAGATGFYGAQTTRAMAAFQRSQGWRGSEADGLPGPETLRRLGAATSAVRTSTSNRAAKATKSPTPPAVASVTLSKARTKKLQKRLIRRGYRIPSGPTGWYGPETTKAVAAFQRDQGWRGSGADGVAGPLTLKRLGL